MDKIKLNIILRAEKTMGDRGKIVETAIEYKEEETLEQLVHRVEDVVKDLYYGDVIEIRKCF